MTELLLGCGFSRKKLLGQRGHALEWQDLITLDHNRACAPDLVCDLDNFEWRIEEEGDTDQGRKCLDGVWIKPDFFDEVHAYEVLEHLGAQGDAPAFFACFANIHRILKPNGYLFATVPSRHSQWAWGDPSHRRIIGQEAIIFLDQEKIAMNRKRGTQMSDFSDLWTRDFRIIASSDDHLNHRFCLQAIK
jgi:SAM-dependent methyltransferase